MSFNSQVGRKISHPQSEKSSKERKYGCWIKWAIATFFSTIFWLHLAILYNIINQPTWHPLYKKHGPSDSTSKYSSSEEELSKDGAEANVMTTSAVMMDSQQPKVQSAKETKPPGVTGMLNQTELDVKRKEYGLPEKPRFELIPEERRKTPELKHKLRFDWTNLPLLSPLAKRFEAHQTNCSLPLGNFQWRRKVFGMGSELHVWGQTLCVGMEHGLRIQTPQRRDRPWVWIDEVECAAPSSQESALIDDKANYYRGHTDLSTLSCYFPSAELQCPEDKSRTTLNYLLNFTLPRIPSAFTHNCQSVWNGTQGADISTVRNSAAEFLFSKVSPLVVRDAERQLNLVFPDGVPPDLITVHMRWGDKKFENKLLGVGDYVRGVQKILGERGLPPDHPANIFLATEDPQALEAFEKSMPSGWKVHVDQFYYDLIPYRPQEEVPYNIVPKISRVLKGKVGLWTLGSLLVAMEANSFVLTTVSNWSRIMNELRKAMVDPRCNGCTHMVDLKYGEW